MVAYNATNVVAYDATTVVAYTTTQTSDHYSLVIQFIDTLLADKNSIIYGIFVEFYFETYNF